MKLLAMRSFDVNDPLPGLGKKVDPTAPAKPAPVPVPSPTGRQGVFRGPDGKLHTAIPENEKSQMPAPYGFGPTAETMLVWEELGLDSMAAACAAALIRLIERKHTIGAYEVVKAAPSTATEALAEQRKRASIAQYYEDRRPPAKVRAK